MVQLTLRIARQDVMFTAAVVAELWMWGCTLAQNHMNCDVGHATDANLSSAMHTPVGASQTLRRRGPSGYGPAGSCIAGGVPQVRHAYCSCS
jgi:hypothetical protein